MSKRIKRCKLIFALGVLFAGCSFSDANPGDAGPSDFCDCDMDFEQGDSSLVDALDGEGDIGVDGDDLGQGDTSDGVGDSDVACVSDRNELIDAIKLAQPGSTIQMCEGQWKDLSLSITTDGTAELPVTIKARICGQTVISGTSEIRIYGDHVVVDGLVFTNGEPVGGNGVVRLFGAYDRLTNTLIDGFNGVNKKWVSLESGSTYCEIDHCRFANKNSQGSLLTVWRSDSSAQYHHIHHNHFVDYADGGGENGFEALRIGTSDKSQSDSFTTVEYNLFERCDGEIEIISVKSGKNIIRGNTFVQSNGLLTLRHGKGNTVEDNVFLQAGAKGGGGIRIYDGEHLVRNNYISGVRTTSNARGGIVVHSGLNRLGVPEPALNAQWTPFDVTINNNTIYDSQQSFLYGGNYTYPAWGIVFENNVVYNDGIFPVIREDLALDGPRYSKERYWGSELGIALTAGLSFTPITDLFQTVDGLWLSQSGGAQNIRPLSPEELGPKQ